MNTELQKLEQVAQSAFRRAINLQGLFGRGKKEVVVYTKDGDTCFDFFFTMRDGTQWNPSVVLSKPSRDYKQLEEELFYTLIS